MAIFFGPVCRSFCARPAAANLLGVALVLLAPAAAVNPTTASLPEGSRQGVVERGSEKSAQPRGRFLLLSDAEAWGRLPPAVAGGGQPLPAWARTLAAALPDTTAAMLELDYRHRVASPLPPALRGGLRWAAAHAVRCVPAEACALADLRRAGIDGAAIRALTLAPEALPAGEQAALAFARKLTLAADTVTDSEVARLVACHGEKQVVAMVLLVAYANFQDRLLLALDLPAEVEPLPAPQVRFAGKSAGTRVAPRPHSPSAKPALPPPAPVVDVEWPAQDLDQMHRGMQEQRARRPRIALPVGGHGQVHWGAVCRAYQPELAAAWAACGHAFDTEAEQDPVFDQSLFWVVTHSVRCFY